MPILSALALCTAQAASVNLSTGPAFVTLDRLCQKGYLGGKGVRSTFQVLTKKDGVNPRRITFSNGTLEIVVGMTTGQVHSISRTNKHELVELFKNKPDTNNSAQINSKKPFGRFDQRLKERVRQVFADLNLSSFSEKIMNSCSIELQKRPILRLFGFRAYEQNSLSPEYFVELNLNLNSRLIENFDINNSIIVDFTRERSAEQAKSIAIKLWKSHNMELSNSRIRTELMFAVDHSLNKLNGGDGPLILTQHWLVTDTGDLENKALVAAVNLVNEDPPRLVPLPMY